MCKDIIKKWNVEKKCEKTTPTSQFYAKKSEKSI